MKNTKKILGILLIIILGGLVYLALRTIPISQKPETQTKKEMDGGEAQGPTQETKLETVKKLLYRQNISSVVELRMIDISGQNKKLIFTDADEDFQIRLVDGPPKADFVLVFATFLNETTGSVWEIKIDGSGSKKQIIDKFTTSSFSSDGEKVAFISYDNIKGIYALWISNLDGRYRTKILESETVLSDPVFISDKALGFIKITSEGDGTILTINLDGSNQKEILKSKGELIYSLYFSSSKFIYIKTPKIGGQENLAEVYTFDGQNEKKITNDKEADGYPVLSKDGLKIAFVKNGKIWLGNSDGSNLRLLIEGSQPIGFVE